MRLGRGILLLFESAPLKLIKHCRWDTGARFSDGDPNLSCRKRS